MVDFSNRMDKSQISFGSAEEHDYYKKGESNQALLFLYPGMDKRYYFTSP